MRHHTHAEVRAADEDLAQAIDRVRQRHDHRERLDDRGQAADREQDAREQQRIRRRRLPAAPICCLRRSGGRRWCAETGSSPARRSSMLGSTASKVLAARAGWSATLPSPMLARNEPEILALKAYREVFWNTARTDLKQGRVHHLEWLTWREVESRARVEGWRPEFVEELRKRRGQYSEWIGTTTGRRDPNAPEVVPLDESWKWDTRTLDSADLFEIAHCIQFVNDEDGVPVLWHTLYSPHVDTKRGEPVYGLHEAIEDNTGDVPYVVGTLERLSRRLIDSRG